MKQILLNCDVIVNSVSIHISFIIFTIIIFIRNILLHNCQFILNI